MRIGAKALHAIVQHPIPALQGSMVAQQLKQGFFRQRYLRRFALHKHPRAMPGIKHKRIETGGNTRRGNTLFYRNGRCRITRFGEAMVQKILPHGFLGRVPHPAPADGVEHLRWEAGTAAQAKRAGMQR